MKRKHLLLFTVMLFFVPAITQNKYFTGQDDSFIVGSPIFPKDGGNNIVGIVYKYDNNSGKGMMLRIGDTKMQWGGYLKLIPVLAYKTETDIDMSGRSNTSEIVDALGDNNLDFSSLTDERNGNYTAKWCNDLNIGGYADWYMPTAEDLGEIYTVKQQLTSLTSLPGGYWTSDHLGPYLAWAYYFENGKKHPVLKFQPKNICAIHEFETGSSNLNGINDNTSLSYYIRDSYLYLTKLPVTEMRLYNQCGQLTGTSETNRILVPQHGIYILEVTAERKRYLQKITWY